MLRKFSEELYVQLSESLEAVSTNKHEPLKRMTASISNVRSSLHSLKEYIGKHPFSGQEEEIYFFKHIKPKFYARQIYEVQLYKIEDSKPHGTAETLRKYYEAELNFIERFFQQNRFLYEYYRNGMTELDSLYFIRGTEVQMVLFPDIPELQPEFSTSCDYQFSKFLAYELLYKHILSKLEKLNTFTTESPSQKKFKWTGEIVNLIELAHGVYLNEQINGGRIGIVEFFDELGEVFGVNLGVPKKGFDDLKKRKRLSKTNFTDRMRDALLKRMDEEDAWEPGKEGRKNTGSY